MRNEEKRQKESANKTAGGIFAFSAILTGGGFGLLFTPAAPLGLALFAFGLVGLSVSGLFLFLNCIRIPRGTTEQERKKLLQQEKIEEDEGVSKQKKENDFVKKMAIVLKGHQEEKNVLHTLPREVFNKVLTHTSEDVSVTPYFNKKMAHISNGYIPSITEKKELRWDVDYSNDQPVEKEKSGSFFGKIANFFRKKDNNNNQKSYRTFDNNNNSNNNNRAFR